MGCALPKIVRRRALSLTNESFYVTCHPFLVSSGFDNAKWLVEVLRGENKCVDVANGASRVWMKPLEEAAEIKFVDRGDCRTYFSRASEDLATRRPRRFVGVQW
jgi:hypothetical protein